MQETSFIQESWNIKRIIIAIILLIILAGILLGAKQYILDKNRFSQQPTSNTLSSSVKGTSAKKQEDITKDLQEELKKIFSSPSDNLKTSVQEKMESITEQVSNLKAEEIASSSPQVQKIINDLKSLEDYPKNQAKESCQRICDSIK